VMHKAVALFDEFPQGPLGEARLIEWAVDEARIRLNLADIDRLGCLLDRAELKPAPASELIIEPKSLESTFTYLGESLVLIEHAQDEGKAILRSRPPLLEGSQIQYYELVVDRSEGLSLTRYAYDSVACQRTPVAAPLTMHALGRLIDDLKRLAAEIKTRARSR